MEAQRVKLGKSRSLLTDKEGSTFQVYGDSVLLS